MSAASYRPCHRALVVLVIVALLASFLVVFPATTLAAGTSVVANCDDTVSPATDGSLRAAVEAANADGTAAANDPHVITFALAPACDTITLAGTQLTIDQHVDIQGPGAALLVVSVDGPSRVLEIGSGATATISGLTITGGSAEQGGGIVNNGTLAIIDSTFIGNGATFGGGIYNASSGALTITGSTLSGNGASSSGGGIHNVSSGTLAIIDSTFSGNSAANGGSIYNASSGALTITGSTLSDSSATVLAGGVYNNNGTLMIENSTLSGNSASIGGGIHSFQGTLTIENSTLSGNSASTSGGGIRNSSGTVTITGSTLVDNNASNGGGVYSSSGTVTFADSTLNGNSADVGAGIFSDSGMLAISGSTLSGNSATGNGGGIYSVTGSTVTVTSSTFSGNSAVFDGGGIYSSGALTVTSSTLSGNSADTGGGILNHLGAATLAGTLLAGQTAGGNCGGDAFDSDGYNLSDDSTCGLSGTGDLDDNPNAALGLLEDHGGPTLTHALGPDSEAFDAIPSSDCPAETDQRGVERPQGAGCDIGAFEARIPAITLTLDPAEPDGQDGWYVSDITVTWEIKGETVGEGEGCEDQVVDTDTAGIELTCVVTSPDTGAITFDPVTVKRDATAPVVTVPENFTVVAPDGNGVVVNYDPATATDNLSGATEPVCEPPTNSTFQPGVTEVVCQSTDGAGNVGTNSFFVTVVRDWVQGCLYAGALSQVSTLGYGDSSMVTCSRGEAVVLVQGDDFFGCLFAGSLSQVNEDGPPANCGRGVAISLTTGEHLKGCLFAGQLSQMSYSTPSSCGRGVPVGLTMAIS